MGVRAAVRSEAKPGGARGTLQVFFHPTRREVLKRELTYVSEKMSTCVV